MKKFEKILFYILFSVILFSACREDVPVQTTFQKKYSLTCVLRGDTAYQVAILNQSYPSPKSSSYEHYVKKAEITLWLNNEKYFFRDSVKERINTTRYKDSVYFYYVNNLQLKPQANAKIKAELPDGNILSSEMEIPRKVDFDNTATSTTIPPESADEITIAWKPMEEDLLYEVKLKIIYYIRVNGNYEHHEALVPVKFDENGSAVFPKPSLLTEINYPMNVFNETMRNLSGNEPNKSNFYIEKAVCTLFVFDKNLSSYYAATHFTDKYSIRLDEIDFTNINGGFGIFGCWLKEEKSIAIDESYINDFGYRKKK